MVEEHRLSKAKACRIAGLSRAALHRESTDRIERDSAVVSALNETVERHGRWGTGNASSGYAIKVIHGITNACIGCIAAWN
jgi:hypothetical protein